MSKKNILAIETSCDDTAVSLLVDGQIYSNIIISSAEIQNTFGGVVPEVAARNHENNIISAFKQAVEGFNVCDIDLIAYTSEPGLRVCLNVGEAFATSLSTQLNIPLMKINHIHSHLFAFFEGQDTEIKFPLLGLVASGGHTSIFLIKSAIDIEVLNETSDDAVGECFDKIARSLKLGYPGGPIIDKLYAAEKANIKFVKSKQVPENAFSFSGLKTAVLNYINQKVMKNEEIDKEVIASSFQKEIIDMIIQKVEYYVQNTGIKRLAVGGGVSCNALLKQELNKLELEELYYPKSNKMSSDNAAMIAIYANLINKSNH
ncbi:MAG: tRNA (adenosine(37)-N6)-threonylcarbamoyltransferase complex transferase subunit TsaD [Mycoplasma sp.]